MPAQSHFIPSSADGARRAALAALFTAIAAAALVACQPAVAPANASAAGAAPAAPVVPVVAVEQRNLETTVTQVARVEASQRVEVRPRVAGPIDAVLFREGDIVQAGQPLFRIDTRPFDAAVARAQAELQLAQARENLARAEASRARQLAAESAISTEELERRMAAQAEAQARSAAAQAALQSITLDREFALIRSPITGRIGRALVTTGNVVGAGANQPALAVIVSVAPLHVHFDLSDRQVLEQRGSGAGLRHWQARILDADGQRELARAPVDFADNEIVAATGTLRLRARVDAPNPRLTPGQFVRVQLSTGGQQPALLVPDKAIGTDQGQRFVLVVPADGKVAYRAVQVGAAHGDMRVVTTGLLAGDQVIVSGLMRVRPGMTVKAQIATSPALAEQAQAAQPSKS